MDLAGNVESQNSLDVPIRNDVVFEAPSAPLDMQADVVGNNIQLSWQVPSSNGNATILGYYLYKSSGSGYVKLATVTGLEYSDSSIVLGTTYSYYVTAYNAVGEGQASSPVSMQFVSLPSPPSGLTASVTNGEIVLTWSAPSNTGGLPIQNYILVRNSAVGEERTQLAADIVRFEDSSVVEGQTYQYTLYSINAMGQSASGASATIKVPYQMSEPAYLKATLTDNEVVLQWSAPNGSVPTAYIIKRSLGSFSAQSTILATVTELAYVDSDLAAGTTYCYRVYAVYGEEVGPAAQASVTLPNELPSVPTGLTATVTGNGSMLTWSLADASGQGVTGYHIYRLAQGGSAPTLLAETSELSYLDNAVQAGTNYSYWVAAVNDAGEGARAGPALAVIPAIVETAPSAPQSLQYQVDGDLLLLSWSAPVTAGTSEILGYRVYRSLENSSMALIAIVKASNFTDSTTVSGQDYRYWVCAYNNAGNGAMAGPLAFVRAVQQVYDPTVPESLTASNSEGYVTLTWSAASGDVIGYNIYCGNGTDDMKLLATVPASLLNYVDDSNGASKYYSICALYANGEGSHTTPVFVQGRLFLHHRHSQFRHRFRRSALVLGHDRTDVPDPGGRWAHRAPEALIALRTLSRPRLAESMPSPIFSDWNMDSDSWNAPSASSRSPFLINISPRPSMSVAAPSISPAFFFSSMASTMLSLASLNRDRAKRHRLAMESILERCSGSSISRHSAAASSKFSSAASHFCSPTSSVPATASFLMVTNLTDRMNPVMFSCRLARRMSGGSSMNCGGFCTVVNSCSMTFFDLARTP